MFPGRTCCDAAQSEYRSDVLQEKSEVKVNLASRKPKEQEEGQTRKVDSLCCGAHINLVDVL